MIIKNAIAINFFEIFICLILNQIFLYNLISD